MLKAIPTTYRGIEFRSKLEAKYAQAFDRLGIVWEYEGHGFAFDDGTWYCPDFYMPEIDTYFEVKGYINKDSMHKIEMLAYDERKRVVIGHADGSITFIDNSPEGCSNGWAKSVAIARCNECSRVYFMDYEGLYMCPGCKAHDGTHHYEIIACNFDPWDDKRPNVFEAAGWGDVR